MIQEHFGTLRKRENLVAIHTEVCAGAFVLDSPEPFPGFHSYYGDSPRDSNPLYTYLILDEQYPLDKLVRASCGVMENRDVQFEAAPCKITFDKKKINAIRIRGIENYQSLPIIIEGYRDEGLDFQSESSRKLGGDALISINKFFKIMPIGEGLFIGTERQDHGYISIPRRLSWKEFEELTVQVRYNWTLPQFDVAIGFYYNNYQVFDIIRIYHPDMNQEYLRNVQRAFFTKLEV